MKTQTDKPLSTVKSLDSVYAFQKSTEAKLSSASVASDSPNITTRQATFKATYRQSLREAVEQFPEQYVWRYAGDLQTEVERVAERMFDAMNRGSFNHDSKAFKITARKLEIKPTRTAILAYWKA